MALRSSADEATGLTSVVASALAPCPTAGAAQELVAPGLTEMGAASCGTRVAPTA